MEYPLCQIELQFKDNFVWGVCIHKARYLENHYDHTFIRLSSGYI